MGDSFISYKPIGRNTVPKWRGPAAILDYDATGATAKFQNQTFKVARYCARKRRGPVGVGDLCGLDATHSQHSAPEEAAMDMSACEPDAEENSIPTMEEQQRGVVIPPPLGDVTLNAILAPSPGCNLPVIGNASMKMSPELHRRIMIIRPMMNSSKRADDVVTLRRIPSPWKHAAVVDRSVGRQAARYTSEKISSASKKRSLVVVGNEIAKRHAQWWDPTMRKTKGASRVAPLDGVNAAIPVRAADLCGEKSGEELASLGI